MCFNCNKGIVIVALLLHLGFQVSEKDSELSNDQLSAKLIDYKIKNIVLLQIDNIMFSQAIYKSFIAKIFKNDECQ